MRSTTALVAAVALCLAAGVPASAQQNQPAPAAGTSDIYHVHFTKAVPGQAEALGKALMAPDTAAPMPEHFVVLRHQEGDDWDYVVIQHLGPKATLSATPMTPNPANDMRAWHDDTFVIGPSWSEFSQAMGIGTTGGGAGVYVVSVHRTAAGHRDQLQKALNQAPPSSGKIQTGNVFMQHIEGASWTFLTITRYNSWQDLAADRSAAASAAGAAGGWADIRQHVAFHRDTIADRIK